MAILEIFEKVNKQRKKAEQKQALKNVSVGLAIGTAVGAAAGVLLAPKSGKETREELAKGANEAVEHVKEVTEHMKGKAEGFKEQVKQKIDACDSEEASRSALEAAMDDMGAPEEVNKYNR